MLSCCSLHACIYTARWVCVSGCIKFLSGCLGSSDWLTLSSAQLAYRDKIQYWEMMHTCTQQIMRMCLLACCLQTSRRWSLLLCCAHHDTPARNCSESHPSADPIRSEVGVAVQRLVALGLVSVRLPVPIWLPHYRRRSTYGCGGWVNERPEAFFSSEKFVINRCVPIKYWICFFLTNF